MMGFIKSFENVAFGLGMQALNGGRGGQQVRTKVIRETSNASMSKVLVALRQARNERDQARLERDLARDEVRRLNALLAKR